MVGIHADERDAGSTLEVPMGLPLELRLPPAGTGWEPVGSPAPLALQSVETDERGTTATWMAQGQGTAGLRLVSTAADGSEQSFEATVTVTEPLMNE